VSAWLDLALAGVMITGLLLMVAGRLATVVRLLAVQAAVLAAVPVLGQWPEHSVAIYAVASANLAIKAVMFPLLIGWTARRVKVQRELEPLVSPAVAVAFAVLFIISALALGSRLEPPLGVTSELAVPVALFTILAGLFLIVARRKALTQVAGYLVLENGIFAFGTSLAWEQAVIVELGVLLDVFAAVFVMGITVFQINRTFDSIDVDEMAALRDTRR
jgi:hydrogenase-4 component E